MDIKTIWIVAIVLAVLAAVGAFLTMKPRKETWFSRNLNYGRANGILWSRYLKKNTKSVMEVDEDIKKTYPYLGTGDFTGFRCRGPKNFRCTTYSNYNDSI
jgi:hypothetical protein